MPLTNQDLAPSADYVLEVDLVGPISIRRRDGTPVELPRKVRALFAYLLTRRGTTVPRQTLIGLLWGDRAEEQARSSLRQALSVLRAALDDLAGAVLIATAESVSVAAGSVRTDLDRMFGDDGRAQSLPTPRTFVFLEGLSIGEAPYEAWLREERERARIRLIDWQKALAERDVEKGELDRAAMRLAAVLRHAPTDEAAHRQLMRLHLRRSQTDAALRQFDACRTQLRECLNVEPEAATRELFLEARRLRRQSSVPESDEPGVTDAAARFLIAMSGPDRAARIFEAEVERHGGRMVGDEAIPTAAFEDAKTALQMGLAFRKRLSEAPNGGGVALALHHFERTEPGAAYGPADRQRLGEVLDTAPAGAIHVSTRFFNAVRRNSPCFFEDLSQSGPAELRGVYKVGRPMHRQPYLAVYNDPAPRRAKRPCSLAVAPIRTVGPDAAGSDHWADGLTEDLILELSRVGRIEVSSRTTLQAIRSQDAVEIGRALGVGYVLSGSFRRLGRTARLNFALADAETGRIVWSERFTPEFDGILDVVDDIVAKVVARVAGRIEHSEIAAARLKRLENMTAYEHYLRGIWHHRMGGVTAENSRKAVEWFRKAIAADPSWHRPYAMLCCAWSDLPDYDEERADRSVMRAYEADPTDPEANRIMAWVKFKKGEHDQGIRIAERSVELASHDAYLLGRCAVLHVFNGAPETGLARLQRAVELDPFVPVYIVEEFLTAYYAMGDFEKVLSEAGGLSHQTRRSRYYTAASLVALGRDAEAARVMRAALQDDPTLTLDYVRGQKLFRDRRVMTILLDRVRRAGLAER